MHEKITKKRIDEFKDQLASLGGSAGNEKLRTNLKWDKEFYWRVQGKLIEDGSIVTGRGRGGSVRLVESGIVSGVIREEAVTGTAPDDDRIAEIPISSDSEVLALREDEGAPQVEPGRRRRNLERPLYAPIKTTIKDFWVTRFNFANLVVEETHSQGARATGGKFSRPDLIIVGIRTYVFLSKQIEIVTIEIKPAEYVDIMAVLEAIAHREAAHRSYVFYAVGRDVFDQSIESERILQLAQKFGIGLVLTEDPEDVESWEVVIDALRHEPDPGRLDKFLDDLPSEETKKQLHKWMT